MHQSDISHYSQSATGCCDVYSHYPGEDLEELSCGTDLFLRKTVEVEDGIACAPGGELEVATFAALSSPYGCGELHLPFARLLLVAKLYHGAHLVHSRFVLAVAYFPYPFGGIDYAVSLFLHKALEDCDIHTSNEFKRLIKKSMWTNVGRVPKQAVVKK
nr:hypothetical protein [Bacteroides caecigallinarum]